MGKRLSVMLVAAMVMCCMAGCSSNEDKELIQSLTNELEQTASSLSDSRAELEDVSNQFAEAISELETVKEALTEAETRITELEQTIVDMQAEQERTAAAAEVETPTASTSSAQSVTSGSGSSGSSGGSVWTPPAGVTPPGVTGDDGKLQEGGVISDGNKPGDELINWGN